MGSGGYGRFDIFSFKFSSFLKNLAVCPSRTVSFKLMKSQCNLALIDKSSNPDCQVLADFSIFSVKSVSHALRLTYPCGKPWMDFVLSQSVDWGILFLDCRAYQNSWEKTICDPGNFQQPFEFCIDT